MPYITLYVISIFVSSLIEYTMSNRIFKDAADIGYKIDIRRVKTLFNSYSNRSILDKQIKCFIPIINLMTSIITIKDYYKYRNYFLTYLNWVGALIPLTEHEQKEYERNSNIQTAIKINKNFEIAKKTSLIDSKKEIQNEKKLTIPKINKEIRSEFRNCYTSKTRINELYKLKQSLIDEKNERKEEKKLVKKRK